MKKEYSYGAVVYQYKNGQIVYLIEHMALGHVSLPKGHIEKGETPVMCAKRELKEETNLDVEIDTSFQYVITYLPKPDVSKDVTFFLGKPTTLDLKPQLEEVESLEWVTLNQALSLFTFQTDKDVLIAADKAIRENKIE